MEGHNQERMGAVVEGHNQEEEVVAEVEGHSGN